MQIKSQLSEMAIRTMGCIESSGSGDKDRSGNEDAPTVRFLRPFSDFQESVDIFTTGSFCVPSFALKDGKERRHETEDSLRERVPDNHAGRRNNGGTVGIPLT